MRPTLSIVLVLAGLAAACGDDGAAASAADADATHRADTAADDVTAPGDVTSTGDVAASADATDPSTTTDATDVTGGAGDAVGADAVADDAGGDALSGPQAQETLNGWTFTRIVDLDTPAPAGLPDFTGLAPDPVVEPDGVVTFRACTRPLVVPPMGSQTDAVLRWDGGALFVVAAAGDPAPRSGAAFEAFDARVVNTARARDGSVVFVANSANEGRGVYRWSNGVLRTVVDRATAVPGTDGDYFFFFGSPLVDGDASLFGATGPRAGVWARDGAGLYQVVGADDAIPNGVGGFLGVGAHDVSDGVVTLMGNGQPPAGVDPATFPEGNPVLSGIYLRSLDRGPIALVADKLTPVPGRSEGFFVLTGPRADGDTVIFHGRAAPDEGLGPFGSVVYKGLYRAEPAGDGYAVETVVDTDTTMPGGTETFSRAFANGLASHYQAAHGGRILFRGVGTVGDEKTRIGLYLYESKGGDLSKVIDTSDRLYERGITDVLMSTDAIAGDWITFFVTHDDGSEALYVGRREAP